MGAGEGALTRTRPTGRGRSRSFHPTVQYTDDHRSNGAVDEPWHKFNDAQSALTAVEWIKNASKYTEPFFRG